MDIGSINLKVLVMDTDYYALRAINGYLAWDRRTRVTFLAESAEAMWDYLDKTPLAELPHIVLLDASHLGTPAMLAETIHRLTAKIRDVKVLCLAQSLDLALVEAAASAGARGYLLKGEVRLQIASAIVYALNREFVVSPGVYRALPQSPTGPLAHAIVLPRQAQYPELTDRIRQAIELCALEGLPAQLAADEMGISLHTVRSYIKEGYRIMEAYDETEYPVNMSPQERAFMRLTRFVDEE